ncbi:uncharacterized protein Bfra_008671sa [Botrytis fragariae]|uniref:Uncharacterized protein n=1 Tax=Botrytis fragariae TaxID=1964551 RepID=A0A8H6AQH4_9HELO|nr:uncharacterized protein Bfra_008671sa [Botrytis fragariae]KAF5871648.1 hypothetical protein Bfra_008671sa [Botrytis fragariae]
MTYQNSQIPRTCRSCGETHSPPKLCYIPLKCWNCGIEHFPTQEFCYNCNGWILPSHPRETVEEPKKRIDWKKFLIANTDSSEVKSEQLKNAEIAIKNDQYTAVLCAESLDSPYGKNEKKKTAVFLHRPGGDKRLSFTKLGPVDLQASSRRWVEIKLADWATFEEIVGVTPLPSTFPTPGNICLLEDDELDTDVGIFDGGSLLAGSDAI